MYTIGRKITLIAAFLLLLSACGANTMYEWQGYNYALLKHYKDGTDSSQLAEQLQEIVNKSEEKGKVPPGLYAELGYAYLESNQTDLAISYFQKEQETWPESRVFLSNVISRIQ